MASRSDLAPDGRIGLIGISFAGGMSLVAAGRPSIRDKLAYIVSFGGHADLPRVLHYLATGEQTQLPASATVPPHDYGVAVILTSSPIRESSLPSRCAAEERDRDVSLCVAAHPGRHEPGKRDVRTSAEYAKTLPEPARRT
jgi:hypothetical protein